jgi:spore germination protein YaaH
MVTFTGAALLLPSLLVPSAQASQTPSDSSSAPPAAGGELAVLLPNGPDNSNPAPQVNAAPIPAPAPAPATHMIRWVYMVGGQLPDGVRQHPEDVDVISPAWFHLNSAGDVYGNDVPSVTQFAKANGIKIMPIVDNGEFDPDAGHAVVANGSTTTRALDGLTWLVNNYGYDGINIDFENMYNADRDLFSGFMSNVYARVHRENGKMVTIAIGSKTQETYGGFSGMFDYAALAPSFDLAVIMTYDQHYAGGDPGPVASIQWVNDVINYATKVIPPNKLLLGLPFYGYNWNVSRGGWARAMSYGDIVQTVFDHGPGIQMDAASQTPVYVYDSGNGVHQIWFENSTSLAAKLALAAKYNLAGWGAWRGGMEDQNFWGLNLSPATP